MSELRMNNEGFDTGSNYSFGNKMQVANAPRSVFDLSHLVTTTIDNAGLVVPISLWETLPGSDYEINVKSLVRVMPQVVPLYSRQRLYVYAFYSRCSDLWAGFQTFIRKGYSGNVVKSVPVPQGAFGGVMPTNPEFDSSSIKLLPCCLSDYLGIPQGISSFGFSCSALPYMMYTRVWRDYFLNKNYYLTANGTTSNKSLCILPDDDSRFRLGDDGKIMSFADVSASYISIVDLYGGFNYGYSNGTLTPSKGMSWVDDTHFIQGLFYHDYPDDYFTSALPFPQRGDTPSLVVDDLTLSSIRLSATGATGDLFYYDSASDVEIQAAGDANKRWQVLTSGTPKGIIYASGGSSGGSSVNSSLNQGFNNWFNSRLNSSVGSYSGSLALGITLEDLRELAVAQTILEKMARTDGSYYDFGVTFFGEPSKAATDYRPVFIGGTYTPLQFTEVLQTSQSTPSSSSGGASVLGQYAGHGIGVDQSGQIGRVHTDDYGYIMILACIMPDVYYHQGLDKLWSRKLQSDWYLPERARLGMQPITNKEIFLQAQSVVDSDGNPVNDNLWAYQDIYDEYRYRANRISGKIADSTNKSFYPFTQARKFSTLPNWGQEFAEASEVRKDYLASSVEAAYSLQFDINVRAVQPVPYRAIPAEILN